MRRCLVCRRRIWPWQGVVLPLWVEDLTTIHFVCQLKPEARRRQRAHEERLFGPRTKEETKP